MSPQLILVEVNDTCMECGESCDIIEEVDILDGELNLWCYCPDCDVETFHPLPEKKSEDVPVEEWGCVTRGNLTIDKSGLKYDI